LIKLLSLVIVGLFVVAAGVWAVTGAFRSPVPSQSPCWSGIVVSQHVADRVIYEDGSARSVSPLEFYILVVPLGDGPTRAVSMGTGERGLYRAALAEPGSVYTTCPAPVDPSASAL